MYTIPLYVGIILQKDNQFLFVQRHNTDWMSDYWNFPGGLVEADETLLAAAQREAFEELDVIVKPSDFTFVQLLHVRKNDKNTKDILGIYFMTETWQNNPINKEPRRHSAVEWFDKDKLPENITEHALLAIEAIKTGKKYSEHGW